MSEEEKPTKQGGDRRQFFTVSPVVRFFYIVIWVMAFGTLLLFGSFAWIVVQSQPHMQYTILGINALVVLLGAGTLLAVTALLLALYSTVHTHRMMGAAYHIQSVLKRVREGEDAKVTLREGDYFRDLATDLNEVLTSKEKSS